MGMRTAKRLALESITADLRAKLGQEAYNLKEARRALVKAVEAVTVAKRKKAAMFALVRQLEDGLLGPLGRWCDECYEFGHKEHCARRQA